MPKKPVGPKGGTSTFTKGGLARVYVYLAPETRRAVQRLAHDRDSSVSALLVQIIEEYLERQAKPKP